jgi:hypothetical protein
MSQSDELEGYLLEQHTLMVMRQSMNVKHVLWKSSNTYRSSMTTILAWRIETRGLSIRISFPTSRPIDTASLVKGHACPLARTS